MFLFIVTILAFALWLTRRPVTVPEVALGVREDTDPHRAEPGHQTNGGTAPDLTHQMIIPSPSVVRDRRRGGAGAKPETGHRATWTRARRPTRNPPVRRSQAPARRASGEGGRRET